MVRERERGRDNLRPVKGGKDVLEQEPHAIARRASGIGRERLDRTALDILITSAIGGLEVSLGALAAMTVTGAALQAFPELPFPAALALGSVVFPVGFVLVILGRSELFTENFLIPVIAVARRQRPLRRLVRLWGLSWLGNLFGCALMALLLAVPEAVDPSILDGYRAYSDHKLAVPMMGVFVSAVLAGITMTALTWLLLALRNAVDRILAIIGVGYLIFAANLSHSIVGSSELFVGFRLTGHSLTDVIGWLLVATAGNLVGGVGFVTLFRFVQAEEQEDQDGEDESTSRDDRPRSAEGPTTPAPARSVRRAHEAEAGGVGAVSGR